VYGARIVGYIVRYWTLKVMMIGLKICFHLKLCIILI